MDEEIEGHQVRWGTQLMAELLWWQWFPAPALLLEPQPPEVSCILQLGLHSNGPSHHPAVSLYLLPT